MVRGVTLPERACSAYPLPNRRANDGDYARMVMGRFMLSEAMLPFVAGRFKALSEPARLALLSALQSGEQTVNELVDLTGLGQANVSKHLQVLHHHGFVRRRKDGLYVHYTLADRNVMRLCETMSNRLDDRTRLQERLLESPDGME